MHAGDGRSKSGLAATLLIHLPTPWGGRTPLAASGWGGGFCLSAQEAGDQHSLDLGGALSDLVDLHIAPVTRDGVLLHEAIPPVDLHGLVGRAFGSLRGVELAHRG